MSEILTTEHCTVTRHFLLRLSFRRKVRLGISKGHGALESTKHLSGFNARVLADSPPAFSGRVPALGPGAPPARLGGGVGEAGPGTLARRSGAAPPAGALLPRPGSGPGGAGTPA